MNSQVQAAVAPECDSQRYEVRREVPGIAAKDVSVQVLKDTLSIEARAGGVGNSDEEEKVCVYLLDNRVLANELV